MTPDRIALVCTSYARLAMHATAFGEAFYDTLFRLDPALRGMFKHDMTLQASKLMAMLGSIIDGLDQPDRLRETFHDLGERHAGYGATEDQYDRVGEALLQSLKTALGTEFTEAMEAAWASLYAEIAEAMIVAGRVHAPPAVNGDRATS